MSVLFAPVVEAQALARSTGRRCSMDLPTRHLLAPSDVALRVHTMLLLESESGFQACVVYQDDEKVNSIKLLHVHEPPWSQVNPLRI